METRQRPRESGRHLGCPHGARHAVQNFLKPWSSRTAPGSGQGGHASALLGQGPGSEGGGWVRNEASRVQV